jgi:hypothetical protein
MQTYSHIGIVVPTVMEQFPLLEILVQMTGNVDVNRRILQVGSEEEQSFDIGQILVRRCVSIIHDPRLNL